LGYAGGVPTLAERGVLLRPFPVEVRQADASDFGSRRGTPIDTLVLHTTEGGSIEGAVEWWAREEIVASAHYVIDGHRIVQVVPEDLAAYHAGNRGMNRRSIGIEVVGHADKPGTWTPGIMAQLVMLSADVCRRHRIPVVHQTGPGICGHADVQDPHHPGLRGGASHHTDPGRFFPWGHYLDALRAELAAPEGIA
jgi:N-acetyl-anhydromuramyl-L-alanine amidase AmpD